jgi:hypothetical protein
MELKVTRRQLLSCIFMAMLGFAVTTGCDSGPSIAKVTGKVTLNGVPIKGASVQFHPEKGPMATGITDDQGNFTLIPGAPIGMNKVAISKPAPPDTGNSMPANPKPEDMAKMAAQMSQSGSLKRTKPPKSEVPDKYGDPSSSGLTADVTSNAATNNFEFPLK